MSRATRFGPAVPVIRVRSAGPVAGPILREGAPLTVTAVFERSFYCRDGRDRWLCFLRDDLEPGPLHALSENWPTCLGEHISEGQILTLDGRGAMTASTLAVDCAMFREWHPPPFPPPEPRALHRALPLLREAMRMSAPEGTLAEWMLAGRRPGAAVRCAAAEETARALAALSTWLASPHEHPLRDAVQSLVGLGPGLTPTGDDILAGTLLALHALAVKKEADELAVALAAHGPGGTNRISLAHLRAAAAGWGAAPFHDLLTEVLLGREAFDKTLRRIAAIGHTSGWDILMGILTTAECFMAKHEHAAL
ncbi:MAG: DUF2877 domain-containing protein [Planctomycetota bacterium]|jgi:hypothetical protein|nr:DUF2877 domain-containing protein [Planctomycetota bacterium]